LNKWPWGEVELVTLTREKPLILLSEDITGLRSDPSGGLGERPFTSPCILWLQLMKKPFLAFPRVHYQMEVCLPEGKMFMSSRHGLKSWLGDRSPPDTAEGSVPATRTPLCAHTNWRWYALAAPNSVLSLDYTI